MKNLPIPTAIRLESGFSGSENSDLKVDLLFPGFIPQAELYAGVKKALAGHSALVAVLEVMKSRLDSFIINGRCASYADATNGDMGAIMKDRDMISKVLNQI